MTIHEKIAKIQATLKAPKGQMNKFGGYKYRSCEDILTAVKPILDGLVLTITDTIIEVGGRIYVQATATITDGEHEVKTTAFAREEQTKKGMDAAQITGSASSYARKYALNGLLCIDDTKDADTQDNSRHETKVEKISESQVADLEAKMQEVGADEANFMRWLHSSFGASELADLTTEQYPHIIAMLDKKAKQ